MDRIHAGETSGCDHDDLDRGTLDTRGSPRDAAILDELDALIDTIGGDQENDVVDATQPVATPTPGARAMLSDEELAMLAKLDDSEEDATWERIDHEPRLTPYDKARTKLADADTRLSKVGFGSDEYHRAMSDKAVANRELKLALERDADPLYRKRRATDEHRAGDGREEYNASRRKKRTEPNKRLSDMTPEQREQHKREKAADRTWRSKKRKKGVTETEIEVAFAALQAKRRQPA